MRRASFVVPFALLAALAGLLVVYLYVRAINAEEARADAENARADAARRLRSVCNAVNLNLNIALHDKNDDKAADLAVSVMSSIEPCAQSPGRVAEDLVQAALGNDRGALDEALRAALVAVPPR